MKLAIVGGRDFDDYKLFGKMLVRHFSLSRDIWMRYEYREGTQKMVIISGGAKGADSFAKKFVEENEWYMNDIAPNIKYKEFPAEWDKYGKSAGFRRNQQIVDACDMVLAFWDGKSRGTKNTIELAKKAKKTTFIVYY